MERSHSRFFSEGAIAVLYISFLLVFPLAVLHLGLQSGPGFRSAFWLSAVSCALGIMGTFVLMRKDEVRHRNELNLKRAQQDEKKEEAIRAVREKFPDTWQQVLSGLDPYLAPRGALSSVVTSDAGSVSVHEGARGALSQVRNVRN